MNHPKREEWAPYLFGETKLEVRRELNAHLKECADCRQEIENWQRSLARLDAWKLQSVPKPGLNFAPYLNWAAAAALLLLLGFGIGRLTAKADVDKVRAAIEPAMRRELSQEFARLVREEVSKSAVATLAASGQQAEQAIYAVLENLESQSFVQFVSLKKDLDTVALNTDAGLRDTQQELVQLTDYKQPLRAK